MLEAPTSSSSGPTKIKTWKQIDHRLRFPPQLVVDEDTVLRLWSELTDQDRTMCEDFAYMLAGRELQHVVNDTEILNMIKEINKEDLLKVLLSEKGNGARVMMEAMKEIKEPVEFQHNPTTINELFANLKTDFYGRFEFSDMQNVILEDRRVRLNAWAAKILGIPVQKIKLNKHSNPAATAAQKRNPSNLNFTLSRTNPLSLSTKKPSLTCVPLDFPISVIDKKKYQPNEESQVLHKLLHRHAFKFTPIGDPSSSKVASNTVYLMKNLNEGRNGTWDNYSCLKGNGVDSYVKYKSRFDRK